MKATELCWVSVTHQTQWCNPW